MVADAAEGQPSPRALPMHQAALDMDLLAVRADGCPQAQGLSLAAASGLDLDVIRPSVDHLTDSSSLIASARRSRPSRAEAAVARQTRILSNGCESQLAIFVASVRTFG